MRKLLGFSTNQGWPGEMKACRLEAIKGVAASLEPLRSRYDVAVIFAPTFPSRDVTNAALDNLKALGLPFILDGVTSDAIALGLTQEHAPYDMQHGVCVPVGRMWEFKARYGELFLGIRSHETFATDHFVRAGKEKKSDVWAPYREYAPYGDYMDLKAIEPFVAFCRLNHMPFFWSDPYWSGGQPEDKLQLLREQVLRDLTQVYPNTIVPCYANNLNGLAPPPGKTSGTREGEYYSYLRRVVTANTRAWALSEQRLWAVGGRQLLKADMEGAIHWMRGALSSGAGAVLTEPGWVYWDLDAGAERWPIQVLKQQLLA